MTIGPTAVGTVANLTTGMIASDSVAGRTKTSKVTAGYVWLDANPARSPLELRPQVPN